LYGPETRPAHDQLTAYVEQALAGTWPQTGKPVVIEDKDAGRLLDKVAQSLREINPQDAIHKSFLDAALQRARQVEELRWALIAQSDRGVSKPLIFVLVGWLALIFASFGYNAPRNP